MTAENFARAVRLHWVIENSLHWVLDVIMREDERRNRQTNVHHDLAALSWLVLKLAWLQPDTQMCKCIPRTP